MILYMYIASGNKIWCQYKGLSLCPFVASFNKISLMSDFIHIFNDLIHVYSPKAGADNPLETKFWCEQKGLITFPICCKFQINLFQVWFYTHFLMILYMYIASGQGQTATWGQTFDVNRKALSLCPFIGSFKKISLNSDFIHIFSFFYTCI